MVTGTVDAGLSSRTRTVATRAVSGHVPLGTDPVFGALAALFGALADATRVRIVHLLLERELCTSELGSILGVSDSAVSQHLRVLRSLRLVRSRRAGKFLFHSLDDAHIALLVKIGWAHVEHGGKAAVALPGEVEV
jgi:ArsR family transcriptional regulator, lead/cadmium/zinc/bismuth-responsive transcriptional repressor